MSRPPKTVKIEEKDFDRVNAALQATFDAEDAARAAVKQLALKQEEMFKLLDEVTQLPNTRQWGIDHRKREQRELSLIEPHCRGCGVVHEQGDEQHAPHIPGATLIASFKIGPDGLEEITTPENPTKH